MEDVVVLYRPTGPRELALVATSGFRRWPPRLPEQPIFYPVTNEAYARQIAERWNMKESGEGFVTRFSVKRSFLQGYERQVVGAKEHEEYWIPAEDLEAMNDAIVGRIEVVQAHGSVDAGGAPALLLPQDRIEFGGDRPGLPPSLGSLNIVEVACLAASYVSYLSEDYWCAGWLIGAGTDCYQMSLAPGRGTWGHGTLDEVDRIELARLREVLAPWWVEWVDALGGVAMVRIPVPAA